MADINEAGGGYRKFKRNRPNNRFIETPVPNENAFPPNMGRKKSGIRRAFMEMRRLSR